MTQENRGEPAQGPSDAQTDESLCYPRRWTLTEIQSLRDMARAKMSKHEIAPLLDRSTNSIETQARKLGVKLVRIKEAQWLATKPC